MAQVNLECRDRDNTNPTILYPGDVADIMREMHPEAYREARRTFVKEVGIDPRNVRDANFRGFTNYLFSEWLTYDVRLVAVEDDEDLNADDAMDDDVPTYKGPTYEEIVAREGPIGCTLEDKVAITPFDWVASRAHDNGLVDDDQFRDMCEVSDTNFASWFWIRKASAGSQLLVLEDMEEETEYQVTDSATSARYDGTAGGSLVGRLAKVRDQWRLIAPPPMVIREPNDQQEYNRVKMLAQLMLPDYLRMVAMLLPMSPVYQDEIAARHASGRRNANGGGRGSNHGGGSSSNRREQRRNHNNRGNRRNRGK